MTELSFLIELLLNHKLPKVTKDLIALRVKEIEEFRQPQTATLHVRNASTSLAAPQAASTIQAFERHGMNLPIQSERTIKVEDIAQTPMAAAAIASRQQAIAESLAGKVDKQTGRPRKF